MYRSFVFMDPIFLPSAVFLLRDPCIYFCDLRDAHFIPLGVWNMYAFEKKTLKRSCTG